MATTEIPISRLRIPSLSRYTTRSSDFLALMKPRVMSLSVLTALVGLLIAPGHLDPLYGSIAIFAIAAGAGAAGTLNMWYDADIDAVMTRTAMRPIPRGAVSRSEALIFGLILAGSAVAVLGSALNLKAAALLAEIQHLKTLASLNTDPKLLAEIATLIAELERRIRRVSNGG